MQIVIPYPDFFNVLGFVYIAFQKVFRSTDLTVSPIDKIFIIVQALLLTLGALLLGRMGATYVAFIGGLLTAMWRTAWAPFTLFFALLYGLFVDSLFFVFRVSTEGGCVKTNRVIAALTVSTALSGLISYYTTVFISDLLQSNPILELGILIVGTLNGAAAGYLASTFWNKNLKNIKF